MLDVDPLVKVAQAQFADDFLIHNAVTLLVDLRSMTLA
jgi:hypothetical protein